MVCCERLGQSTSPPPRAPSKLKIGCGLVEILSMPNEMTLRSSEGSDLPANVGQFMAELPRNDCDAVSRCMCNTCALHLFQDK